MSIQTDENFIYADGLGHLFDRKGRKLMTLHVDNVGVPLEFCMTFKDFKMLTKNCKENSKKEAKSHNQQSLMNIDQIKIESKRKCLRHSYEIKQKFHEMTVEEGFSAYLAANILGVPKQTAYTWKRKANKQQYCELLGIPLSFKKLGRKPILNQLHKAHLLSIVSENSTLALEKMINSLQENFIDLKVSSSTVYKFVRKLCRLSFKRISLVPSARVLEKTMNERLEWAKTWKSILDFLKNCVFIDEAGFNIGMRRESSWSIEGQKAIKVVPVTRGINISFLGAICSKGLVNLQVKSSATTTNKKRKAPGSTNTGTGTTTNHFFNFIHSVIEEIKSNEELKELKYLIVDNARIHKHEDISTLASNNGLQIVYLPPYLPALNAIEEFWSVCKSKVKTMELTVRSKLTPQVKEACSQISIESFQGFCKYSSENFKLCLESQMI